MAKRKEVVVKGFVIYCENINKEIIVNKENMDWIIFGNAVCSSDVNDEIEISFKCECSKKHTTTIKRF